MSSTLGVFNDLLGCQEQGCELDRSCWGCVPFSNLTLNASLQYAAISTCNQHTAACSSSTGGSYSSFDNCAWYHVHAADAHLINEYVGWFCLLAVGMYTSRVLQYLGSEIAGERLTSRLRIEYFTLLLQKSAGWQDRFPTSQMTEVLSVDAAAARKVYVDTRPMQSYIVGVMGGGILIAYFYCWRMASVMLGLLPLLILTGKGEAAAMVNNDENGLARTLHLASQSAATMLENVGVITSLGRAKRSLADYYIALLEQPS